MRRLLGAVGVLAVGGWAPAGDAKPDPADVLVGRLAAPRFADREAAARDILGTGPAAIPALKAALATAADAELRDRAAGLLEQLNRKADSARLVATKVVKLDYKNVPLAAVAADLKAKTGINLTLVPEKVADPARPVTLVVPGDVTAWEAVDALCKAAGLREEFRTELAAPPQQQTSYYNGGGRVVRMYGQDQNAAQVAPGLVPVWLTDGTPEAVGGSRATGVRVLALPGRFPTSKLVRGAGRVLLTLDVTPLPALNWQDVSAVRITRAEDEDGRPLFADMKQVTDAANSNMYGWGWGGGMWMDDGGNGNTNRTPVNPRLVTVPLRTDDRAVKFLRRLEGVVVGEVHQQNMPLVTIDDIAAAAGKPAATGPDDMKLAVSAFAAQKDGRTTVKVRVEMYYPWVLQQAKRNKQNGGNNNPFWGGGFSSDGFGNLQTVLAFADKDGKPVTTPQQGNFSYGGDGWRQSLDVEFTFPKSDKHGPPAKLVFRGTKIATAEVPFRVENVRLP